MDEAGKGGDIAGEGDASAGGRGGFEQEMDYCL